MKEWFKLFIIGFGIGWYVKMERYIFIIFYGVKCELKLGKLVKV